MSDLIFCAIRKEWVVDLPEEKVRQSLIQRMIVELGYPLEGLVIEKSLHQFHHIEIKNSLPQRRIDLVVFASGIHSNHALYPLLLIECKAVPITKKVIRQIAGYNRFMQAYFMAIVNETGCYMEYFPTSEVAYQTLPPYELLLKSISFKKNLIKPFQNLL
jgi:hypothetical protein